MSVDLSHKKEFADAASALIADKAFGQAVLSLRKRWFEQLMAAKADNEKLELVTLLKALEALPTELAILINDYKMAASRQQGQAHG